MSAPAKIPRSVVVFTVVLALLAAGAAAADRLLFGSVAVDWPWLAALLVPMVAGASLQIRFRYRDEVEALDLFEAVLAPVLFAFGGWVVIAAALVANAVAESIRRNQPVKAAFNVAQWTAASAAGVLVLSSLRDGGRLDWHNAGALAAAMAVVLLVNHLAFSIVVALVQGQSLQRVLTGLRTLIVPGWLIGGGLNVAFGFLFVAAYQLSPAVVPLILVPLFALNWASNAYAAARADETRLRGLHRASALLGAVVDPLEVTREFLEEVRACFESEAAELVIVEAGGRLLHRVPEGQPSLAVAVTDMLLALTEPVRLTAPAANAEGWRDCLAAPLRDGHTTIGVLCTYNRTGLEGFEDGELAVLAALADDLVAALQRRRLVQTVVDERQKLRDIVDNTSDGILTLASDGSITSWNPGLEAITGYAATDMIGTKNLALLRPRDEQGSDLFVEHWASQPAALDEVQVVTRSGEARWLACSPSVVHSADGSSDFLVIVARDITRARELERLRADFVATVSHELRTPLAPIKGWATTILTKGDELDERLHREGMESILRQAQRLERLVMNLLEASKIEDGKVAACDTDVEVEVVARRVIEEFHEAWPARELRLDIDHAGCWARASDMHLDQIVSNLVSNAIKYSPDDEPVTVTVRAVAGELQVSVVDRGQGIPHEQHGRIFERFHRVSETKTQAGTGLGLYIAGQLASELGGQITVESAPERGSCFTLHLPLVRRLIAV